MAMDTCSIRRCRWPLLAFINTQVCFKKWEVCVSSVFLSSACCNFQPLKACQANSEDKNTTLNYNKELQGPSQHFTPVSSWTHIPSKVYLRAGLVRWPNSIPCRISHETSSLEDPTSFMMGWKNIRQIFYSGLLPCFNTPSKWFTKACISQIL